MTRILRLKQVTELTGLSRSSIYQKVSEGLFPRQVQLSGRAVGWYSNEIEDWMQSLHRFRVS